MPVFDASNLSYQIKELQQMAEQVKQLKSQLKLAEQQYKTLTGSRGLGAILHNPDLLRALPEEWQDIYRAHSGITGLDETINDIKAAEDLQGGAREQQKNMLERARHKHVFDKALGIEAYAKAHQRLAQIEALMHQINRTHDLKSIGELQARINIEQSQIQNEQLKFQLIQQLQLSEERLIQDQEQALSRRLLDKSNTGMPQLP